MPSSPGSMINQFCVEKCELITTCGEVTVPETHLEVHSAPVARVLIVIVRPFALSVMQIL